MDLKSLLIGFLLCLCMMLLFGFGGSSGIGRYIVTPVGDQAVITDTATGYVKAIKLNMKFVDMPDTVKR